MATIKFKRGSGVPTGLTAYEAAWDTSLGRFFIHNGTTATWIGARIDPDTSLVGNCAYFIPTQNAVKTYIDNQVAGGAVSSVDGVTGAVDLLAGTGISITNPTGAAKGITLAVNSNVALLDTAQTFTALKSFTAGISASTINTLVFGIGNSATAGNITIGDGNLNLITTGTSNISIGVKALTATTSGIKNIGIGLDSLRTNTDGFENIGVGASSLYSNTNGKYNVAFGNEALFANTNNDANTAVGYSALRNTTGGNNTGVGQGSLGNIFFGNNNVGLGKGAGSAVAIGGLGNTSATGGIYIGTESKASTHGRTNEIVIGTNAVGLGSNSAVLGASTQTAAYIYGLVHAMSGVSAPGGTFTGTVTVNGSSVLTSTNGVTSVDGVTGAIDLLGGIGISVTNPTGAAKGITFTNTGVLTNAAGSGISVSGATGNVTITNTGVTGLVAGTGVSVSSATGNVTITNTGVQSIAGTANQISASGSTGAVTLSLPSAVTMPGSLTVTGNLVVNGTTTTVNSTTVTVQDPIIAIGGLTGNIAPASGDVKDRGILYQYNLAPAGTTGATGFFGHDQSTGRFTYIPIVTSVTNDVITGTAGIAEFSGIVSPQRTLTLSGSSGGEVPSTITLTSGLLSSSAVWSASAHRFTTNGSAAQVQIDSDPVNNFSTILTSASTGTRTFTLPNITGTAIVADAAGATSGWLLRAAGPSTQSTWVNPNAAGFTAFTSTNIITTSDTSDTVCFVTFVNTNADGSQSLRYNSGFTYNAVTNYLEVNIDGGAY